MQLTIITYMSCSLGLWEQKIQRLWDDSIGICLRHLCATRNQVGRATDYLRLTSTKSCSHLCILQYARANFDIALLSCIFNKIKRLTIVEQNRLQRSNVAPGYIMEFNFLNKFAHLSCRKIDLHHIVFKTNPWPK